ncbi:MAG: hypothetical protein JO246_05015 [Frankiaceae bacterium]|nr:hypothetical protein [Frankiaceae bacterium]MBV9873054.1 hypothetical protein [Frankiaceae bacterium]
MTVVAAGVAGSMPAIATTATSAAPEASVALEEGSALEGPLIAQVTNLQQGAISLFSGEQEFQIFDRDLAAKLFNAIK